VFEGVMLYYDVINEISLFKQPKFDLAQLEAK
jgi:hypothetical protein